MHAINEYLLLTQRFAQVRRAWKRTAALSGLAIVVTEAVGLFTVLLFLDWLYQPQPLVRVAFAAVALAGLAWLVARHVVKPLLRKIPDEQIALYIEEHRSELDGVLITAAEYYRKREGADSRQSALIDAVIREASQRSSRMSVAHLADFSRLKKYGFIALTGIVAYVVLGILFPNALGHHIGHVLAPWQQTDDDLAKHAAAVALAEPMRFTLSKGNSSLARGSSFDFEATLSKPKPANQTVVLNFRPKTGGDWQKLPMTEIEKLNGFQGSLPDVSEDIEFYVSCGPDKSDTYNLSVYDPLVVQSMETTTHYPDYLKLPDVLVRPSTGDVTAVIGSTVTLRILTSTPLQEGQIKWNDGKTQSVTVDPQANKTATVSFPVTADGTFDYAITDVNGQQAVSPAPLSVHAIPDTPPTISVKSPQSPVLTHMLGEVNFQVDAGDDFGVVGVDLVYSRLDPQGKLQETRLPLTMTPSDSKDMPHGVHVSYHFMLEDAKPPFQPNDAITFHVEARDAKGQVALSPLGFIIVGFFEHWGTWTVPETTSHVHNETGGDVMAMMALIWDLNNEKGQVPPDVFIKKTQEVASKMVDPQGNMLSFVNLRDMPQLTKVAPLIAQHAKNAHDALVANDTATATAEMSTAAALFAGNGIMIDSNIMAASAQSTVGSHFNSPQLTMLEQARLSALTAASKGQSHSESDDAQAKAAEAAAKRVAELAKQQDALIAKAQAESSGAPQSQGDLPANQKPMPSAGSSGGGGGGGGKGSNSAAQAKAKADELSAAQHDLAEQTRAAAEAAKASAASSNNDTLASAADKAIEASKLMEEAARAFSSGKNSEGQDKAGQAKAALQSAGTTLQSSDKDKLAAAISAAESHAAVLLDKQQDLNAETSALSKDLGTKTPDQRQQRDLQKQAYQETQMGAQAEALSTEIDDLSQRAQQVGQAEAIQALTEAQHVIKRSRPQSKMSGAVVDLNNSNPTSADTEQKDAIDALQKIVDSLNSSSDALAASRPSQLSRADRAAQEAKKSLEALSAQAKQQAGAQAQANKDGQGAGSQSGAQGAKGGAGAQAQASKDGKSAGDQAGEQGAKGGAGAQAQAAKDGGAGAKAQTGEQAGAQKGASGDAAGAQSGGQGSGDQAMAGDGPEEEVRKLANNLTQLTAAVDNRQLVPQDKVDQLKEMSMDKAALEKRLMTDPKFLQNVSDIVSNISDKIEAEIEAKTEAGKLFSSQREECPPGYRQFVNQYFEALSQIAPKPGSANAAPSAGQP